MYDSLVPALKMGNIGPLGGWVGSSAPVLAKQTAINNNWSITALKNAALGAVLGNSCLFGQYYRTRAYPPVEWSGPIVPIPTAGTKLLYNYTPGWAPVCTSGSQSS